MNDRITVLMTDGSRYAINSLSGVAAMAQLLEVYGTELPKENEQFKKPCDTCAWQDTDFCVGGTCENYVEKGKEGEACRRAMR